jgi:hypothetical protein
LDLQLHGKKLIIKDTIIKRGVVGTSFFVPLPSQHLDFNLQMIWSLCSMGVVHFVDIGGYIFLTSVA